MALSTLTYQGIFPYDTVYNILYANPDALGEGFLLDSLPYCGGFPLPTPYCLSRFNLPPNLRDSLEARESDTTVRTILQDSIATYSDQYHQMSRDIIMSMLNNSAGYSHSQYRYWLAQLQDPEADYMRIEDYWTTGYSDSAMALLDSVPLKYSLTALQDSSYQTFKNFMNLKNDIRTAGMSISHLDSIHIDSLNTIAQTGTGLGVYKAQDILNFFYGYTYHTNYEIPDTSGETRMLVINNNPQDTLIAVNRNTSFIKAYPNPTSGTEMFEFKLPDGNADGQLVIADMTGQAMVTSILGANAVQTSVDTQKWPNGVYLYRLTCNDKVVGSGKFEVMK